MLPWLHQLLTAPWRSGERTTAAATAPALASSDAAAAAKPDAEHLIFMVHGLFGTRDNWRAIRTLLEQQLESERTALFVSHCNERHKVRVVRACQRGAGRGMPWALPFAAPACNRHSAEPSALHPHAPPADV